MSDRSGAALFATFFERLAEDPARNWEFAAQVWEFMEDFDFDYYQMCCDEALKKLGLARDVQDPDPSAASGDMQTIYFKDHRDGFEDRPEAPVRGAAVKRFEYCVFHEEVKSQYPNKESADATAMAWANALGLQGWEFIRLKWHVREDVLFCPEGAKPLWTLCVEALAKRELHHASLSSETLRKAGGPTRPLSTGVTLDDATVRTIFPTVKDTER